MGEEEVEGEGMDLDGIIEWYDEPRWRDEHVEPENEVRDPFDISFRPIAALGTI